MAETPRPYDPSPQSDFESQYRRMLEAAGCKTQKELAALLDIGQSSVSGAKRRKTIPSDWLMKLLAKKRINPKWIYTGAGGKTFQAPDAPADKPLPPAAANTRKPAQECSTDELLAEIMRRTLNALK